MRCEACGTTVHRWSASPLCPACHAVSGASLSLPDQRQPHSALWLWTSDHARVALATGDLAVIIRAYRAATGASQRQLAEQLGYDPTYISMIETYWLPHQLQRTIRVAESKLPAVADLARSVLVRSRYPSPPGSALQMSG